eukprot:1145305_1
MKETKAHGLWYMICVSVHIANASWTTSTNLLIHSDDQMSIGVHNDTIWLIGGGDFPTQLTQYNVRTQTMTDFGENALTASIKGYGQYWTQQNHMVYIIDQSTGNSLCTYNMITNQFLSTHQWTTSPPNMNVGRKYHACIVHNTYLWAMGGTGCTYNCPNALTSIERIVVTDIMNNKWNIVSNLPVPLYSLRVIDWYDTLYVLGGYSRINNMIGKVDSVYLIDVDSGDVSLSPYSLPSKCAWVSPVIHDSILYIFGGGNYNAWAYYSLPQYTSQPTDTPTYAPSKTTLFPSYVPTDIPIKSTIYGPINTTIITLEEATNHTISSTSNENIYSSESLLNELNEGVEGIWLLIASITIGSVLCVVQIGVVLYCVRRKTKDTQKMIQKSMKEKEPGAEDQDGMEQDNSMIMNSVHHNEELVEEIVSDHNDNVAGDDETLVKDGDMVQYEGVVQGAGWRK